MKLIVGLGNPGDRYEHTRHNAGFMTVDRIALLRNLVFRLENQYQSENADFNFGDERVKLVKPQTFMNNSGEAVMSLKNYYKLDSEDIWVVHDDVDLEMGKVRIVLGGSSAGHKGVQSIIDHLGHDDFWRIRIGVGRSDQIPTEDWVLMNFPDARQIAKIIDGAADVVLELLDKGIDNKTLSVEA